MGIVGVAVDAQHIYWAYYPAQFTGAIGRANLDGSDLDPGFITGTSNITGVAADARYLYWANYANYAGPTDSSIGRANLDGSDSDPGFITDAKNPYFLAVGGG